MAGKIEFYDGTSWITTGNGTVTSVNGVATQTTTGGTATDPIIGLATTAVTAGSYTLLNGTVDSFGRLTSATNGVAVTSVTGTANQVTITGTAAAPIVGITTNPTIPGNAYMTIPLGTTAQRPVTPAAGMIRFNTSL